MSNLIENHFRKISDHKYTTVNQQLWALVMGAIIILLPMFFIFDSVSDGFAWDLVSVTFLGILVVFFIGFSLFLIAMGLFTITTEIDLASRTVRITRRNFRGQRAVNEIPLDTIVINAINMGVTDATPYGAWIVKAGFVFANEAGEECDTAIWSKEVTNVEERNAIMFELYRFFFPDRPAVSESNIITNGTAVMLLSDTEKEEFSKEAALFEKKPGTDIDSGDSKWDRLR